MESDEKSAYFRLPAVEYEPYSIHPSVRILTR